MILLNDYTFKYIVHNIMIKYKKMSLRRYTTMYSRYAKWCEHESRTASAPVTSQEASSSSNSQSKTTSKEDIMHDTEYYYIIYELTYILASYHVCTKQG